MNDLAPLEWTITKPENPRGAQEADDSAGGRWRIVAPTDSVQIKYYPAKRSGADYHSLMAEAKARKEAGIEDRETARLYAEISLGLNEMGRTETFEEAKILIEMLRRGNTDIPPYRDTLMDNGFAIKHPDHESLANLYSRTLRGGTLDINVRGDGAWVTYNGNGANGWHNILYLYSMEAPGQNPQYPNHIIHTFYPDAVTDINDIAAVFMVEVMKRRMERGGRFSIPLGEKLKRIKW